jgi:antitoxin component HigA of HigAB toxin-antitoxin module
MKIQAIRTEDDFNKALANVEQLRRSGRAAG